MTQSRKLFLNLYWHMHQPDYRDADSGEFVLPWTCLHAIKDYTDMASHAEKNPAIRMTFNFVPVLLDQVEDYADQFARRTPRDPLLGMLLHPEGLSLDQVQRARILQSCFKCHGDKMIAPFPAYQRLYALFMALDPADLAGTKYLSDDYMLDVLVWYFLAWTGESVRREYPLVGYLMEKGGGFSAADRGRLYDLIGELVTGLIPRYRALLERGQIEISSTPHAHPILPLLLDFSSARESQPDAALPTCAGYPGGRERAAAQVAAAMGSHYRRFGHAPCGMWPAEGGISQEALMQFAAAGIRWAASGEGVLANSLRLVHGQDALPERRHYLYKPYRVADGAHEIVCFFRDDRLSDKIGFEYAQWHAEDAVADFVHELEQIWKSAIPGETPVVSVILDGENAWEYYPYNGHYFLSELYRVLSGHPFIRTTTFGEVLKQCAAIATDEELLDLESFHGAVNVPEYLPAVCAGSWVYGTFSTWMGVADKNLAWDLLCAAKQAYDGAIGRLSAEGRALAERQLRNCESSDWFWWFGDYNPAGSVASFDQLFRHNLAHLYQLLGLPSPSELNHAISAGGGDPAVGGTMRRGQQEAVHG